LDEPNIECDRKATLGGMPKRRTSSAAISAMSASSSALGSSLTKVSVMNSVCSGQHQRVHRRQPCARRRAADDVAHMLRWWS
jgi:hypothetical protein